MRGVIQLLRRVSQDGSGCLGLAIDEDECRTLDAVVALPLDGEVGVALFEVDGFWIAVPCQRRGESVLFIEQPGISALGREQDKLTDRDDSSVVPGGAALNVAYLIAETKVLAVNHALARSTLDGFSGSGHGAVHRSSVSLARSCRSPSSVRNFAPSTSPLW